MPLLTPRAVPSATERADIAAALAARVAEDATAADDDERADEAAGAVAVDEDEAAAAAPKPAADDGTPWLNDDKTWLSPEEVAVLNALCDANGCVPGEPEVFELPTDPQGNELERQEFINFVRTPPRLLRAQLLSALTLGCSSDGVPLSAGRQNRGREDHRQPNPLRLCRRRGAVLPRLSELGPAFRRLTAAPANSAVPLGIPRRLGLRRAARPSLRDAYGGGGGVGRPRRQRPPIPDGLAPGCHAV